MIDPATITRAVIPVYLIILTGLLARRFGALGREADGPLATLTIHILFPCLILDNLLGNPVVRQSGTVLLAAAAGAGGIAAGMGISLLWGKMVGLGKGSGLRTFALTTGLQNYGFVAIPVLAAVFPGQGQMGVLFVHNLGVELAMWSLGLMILSGGWSGFLRKLINGPIIAVAAGLILVKSGYDTAIPGAVRDTFHALGAAAVPLSLLLVGMTTSDLMFAERPTLRVAVNAIILRLGALAIMLLAAARYLPMPVELKKVMIVQAAMPAAVFPIVLSRLYGGSPAVAIQIVVATGVAAIFTIPLVVAWGSRWVLGG